MFITEELVNGILWCFMIAGGLFLIFLLVSLVMLMVIRPDLPDHVKEGQHEKG